MIASLLGPELNARHRIALGVSLSASALLGIALTIYSTQLSQGQMVFAWAFLALLIVCCFLVAPAVRRGHPDADALAPAVPFALVAFLVFGLGALYWRMGLDPNQSHPDPLPGLVMALVAMIAFAVGYSLPLRRYSNVSARLPAWRPRRAFAAGIICYSIGIVGSFGYFTSTEYFFATRSGISVDLQSIWGFVQGFLFTGLLILAITAFSQKERGWTRILVVVLGLLSVAALLPTGRRYYIYFVMGSVGVPFHYYVKRLRFTAIVAALAISVFIVYPVGQIYRATIAATPNATIKDVPTLISTSASQLPMSDPTTYEQFAVDAHFERMNLASVLSALRSTVPDQMEFKFGATFLPAVTSFIPRLVWPDKPTFQYYNEVGRATGLLAPTNYDTSVVYTSMGELYLDFGDLGVILGMLLYGLIYRRLHRTLVTTQLNPTSIYLYTFLLLPFVTVETPLGQGIPGAVRAAVAGLLVLWLTGALESSFPTLGLRDGHPIWGRSQLSRGGGSPPASPSKLP